MSIGLEARPPEMKPYYKKRSKYVQDKYDRRPIGWYAQDIEDVAKCMNIYLEYAYEEDWPITLSSLAVFLWCDESTIYKWWEKWEKAKELKSHFMNHAKNYLQNGALKRKVDSNTAWLLLGANHWVVRKTERTVTHNNNKLPTKIVVKDMQPEKIEDQSDDVIEVEEG